MSKQIWVSWGKHDRGSAVLVMRRWRLIVPLSCLMLVLCMAGLGWAYARHYRDIVLPHTKIGSLEVGGLTVEQLNQILQQQCQDLRVSFTGAIHTTKPLGELGLNCEIEANIDRVMRANASLKNIFKSALVERRLQGYSTVEKTRAEHISRELTPDSPRKVQDPAIRFDQSSNSFVVWAGQGGESLDSQKLAQSASEAWRNQNNVSAAIGLVQVEPEAVNKPQLSRWADQANILIEPEVRLTARSVSYTLDSAAKAQWVQFDSAGPQLSETALKTWLKNFTEEKVDVKTKPGQRQITKDGRLLKLTRMAWSSLRVSNTDVIASQLLGALQAGQPYRGVFKLSPVPGVYQDIETDASIPMPYQPKPDEKWISVDIENHTATAWEGDRIVWGPEACVNGSLPSPTIPGKFAVRSKQSSARMEGTGWDGDYNVVAPWTMYYSGSYAIHGAPWRYSYVYTPYGGSHGCVNLPTVKARELFEWARVGTPVIVHRNGVF